MTDEAMPADRTEPSLSDLALAIEAVRDFQEQNECESWKPSNPHLRVLLSAAEAWEVVGRNCWQVDYSSIAREWVVWDGVREIGYADTPLAAVRAAMQREATR